MPAALLIAAQRSACTQARIRQAPAGPSAAGVVQQAAQLHAPHPSISWLGYLAWTCAGEVVADKSILPDMMDVVRRLCGASVPFTVDLFCGGVLGGVLRGARRMVAAQPTTDLEEEIAGFVFYEGVPAVVEAFGRAVPQARTSPAKTTSWGLMDLAAGAAGAEAPLCCAGRRTLYMGGDRGARLP